ncbi:MAG: heme-binding protein [Thermoanaerobaculia bacterium]
MRNEGQFEIRDYPEFEVASAAARERYGAFDSLFRFISRGNAARKKIAMTAPVLNDGADMIFIMPYGEPIPPPSDEAVTVGVRPAMRVAAMRFGGFMSIRREQRALTVLRMLITEQTHDPDGYCPMIAQSFDDTP